jgi:putative membrane protein
MMRYGDGYGWMWIFWILLLVGLVVLGVVLVRVLGGGIRRDVPPPGGTTRPPGRSRAREVLDERYARGEISTEEYQERRRGLDEGP